MIDGMVLEQVLGSIHNWFVRETFHVSCTISDGTIPDSIPIPNGVWYRITGSYLNDGMHRKGDYDLDDETFSGTITTHVPPKALMAVVAEISEWQEKYGSITNSPYQSESFGGYSYSKKSGGSGSGENASPTGWQAEFAARLNQWRKLS